MKSFKGRRLADSVSSVGSMILFLIFASCSLIIIAAGASTYSRISDNVHNTFSASTAVKYVTNKIRGSDRVVVEPDGHGLAVYDGEIVCAIMSDGNDIAERSGMAEAYIDYVGGDVIFQNSRLLVEVRDDGMYRIAVMSGHEWCEAYCRCRDSGGDGAEGD
ncbi:MAG: hypothetical protein II820_11375 [Ruminiclostridium sp.]|uniref:DUF4860 domain-containing protein n=1 Tax=uncultured bacterium Ad_136_J17_contig2 TaxID=1489302 RepID=A0A0B4N1E6_9BACT|nr:putative uncharacterized protein [uncultured bacterium Ad_136_J17_contig2]MBQ3843274.1 hypothetical protein [Ruminiclostridium sp.]